MIPGVLALRPVLEASRRLHGAAKQAFFDETASARTELLDGVAAARDAILDALLARNDPVAQSSPQVQPVLSALRRYARCSDWNLIDVSALALCLPERDRHLVTSLAAASLSFHALRMVDDAIDGHHSYKGSYPTMLGELATRPETRPTATTATLLAALPLLCEGLARCPSINDALQRTVFGALHELLACDPRREYDAIVDGKMVSYGLVLYGPVLGAMAPVDRESATAFLRASFRIGQLANDLLDADADRQQGQPNFWNIHGDDAALAMTRDIEHLTRLGEALAPRYQPYVAARICDLGTYAIQAVDRVLACFDGQGNG
jgi:hypothetical protein